jgi:hypothetical protein
MLKETFLCRGEKAGGENLLVDFDGILDVVDMNMR